jgi:GNAT superfamily N-acetyltransferase
MVHYTDSVEGITADMLEGFFDGWPSPPTPEVHLEILRRADHVELALGPADRKVVGFATVLSDGVLTAYLSLLEVLPVFRGQGIGSQLVQRVCAAYADIYALDLLCDPILRPFYEKAGFHSAFGMCVRRYASQAGR